MKTTKCNGFGVISVSEGRLTAEQTEHGRRHMEETFVKLLGTNENDNLYWTGSKTDLVEMAYVAYVGGHVRDRSGAPLSLVALVRRICAVLHVCEPCNIYQTASRARLRKGVKCHTYTERYCWLKYMNGVEEPAAREIKKMG